MPRKGDCTPVLDRIRKKLVVNDFNHCWIWHGALSSQGKYPTIGVKRGEVQYVHRLLYEDRNGPLPDGPAPDGTRWELHHACMNKRCVNPAHISLMTRTKHIQEENRQRELARSAKGNNR